jgi:hypothetical protein
MTSPAPLTVSQILAIQQQFNVASVKSYPPSFAQIDSGPKNPSALFELETVGGMLTLVNNLAPADRLQRANKLLIEGYEAIMLYQLCWLGYDHYQVYKEWADDGITWYPPRYIEGVLQPALGEPHQYALPNAYSAGLGLLGPYPTSKPSGWITVPPMAKLLVPGADVAALLKAWF